MAKMISEGGISRIMTAEEITQLDEAQASANAIEDTIKAENTQVEANRASGNQKLKDLGLTDDEIAALVG